ncbi:MAG: MATE family efflux transporter [Schleiferilactobacillus perolens]|uniref:MATE family efflux transporter n=1 Tax=Schleiferilactobacillus perolens TaxID=100468 RepID=UPI0039EA3D37
MHDLTRGPILKQIIWFTIPLLIGNIFQQMYTVIDTLIVGRTISVQALAAVGSTGSLFMLIIGFAQSTTAGLAIVTAQRYGSGDLRGVKKSFAASIIISLVISAVLTALSLTFTMPLLRLMQTPADIIQDAASFISVLFGGIVIAVFYNLFANMLRALGDSRTPLIFLIIACIVNIALDFWFILGFHMGVAGAGYASLTAQGLSAVMSGWYIWHKVTELVLRRKDFRDLGKEIVPHIRIGLPMGFQASIISVGSLIIQIMLNTLGSQAVAAYTASARIDGLATMPAMSFGITMATFAAQNLGARKYDRIRQGVTKALITSVSVSVVLGTGIILLGKPLVNMFVGTHQPAVTNMAQIYFHFNSSMYFLLAILFIVRYTLQGLGQSMVPTMAGIMELVMRTFAGLILVQMFGFAGASAANPLAWLGSLMVLISSYVRTMRRLKNLAANPQQLAEVKVTGQAPQRLRSEP